MNGSGEGFDGFRIGVAGFDNPMRDIGTEETIRQIHQVTLKSNIINIKTHVVRDSN